MPICRGWRRINSRSFMPRPCFSDSSDRVAAYLIAYGKAGLEDLKLALWHGQGAVRLLLTRRVPVNRTSTPAISGAAELALSHPQLMLGLKYLGYLLGVWLALRGLDRWLVIPGGLLELPSTLVHIRAGVLATVFALILVAASEPLLLNAAPPSEFQLRLPVLIATGDVLPKNSESTPIMNNTSTLLSVALFASLQVAMYFVCLLKIREVARQPLPPLVKLKLMENEENPVRRGPLSRHRGHRGGARAAGDAGHRVEPAGRVRLESLRHYLRGACKNPPCARLQTAADPRSAGRGDHCDMNKTLLLIICDFLLLNLLALTRWEKAEPPQAKRAPVPELAANAVTKEQELFETMRQSLADEKAVRDELAQRLSATDAKALAAREQSLTQAQAERAKVAEERNAVAGRLTEAQRAVTELSQKVGAATQEASMTRGNWPSSQRDLAESRREADRQRRTLADRESQLTDASSARTRCSRWRWSWPSRTKEEPAGNGGRPEGQVELERRDG